MKTKRLKLTALQRAAQFCGAAYELEAFEPQWKRLIDLLADWCDDHKSEIVWASLGLYGNGEWDSLLFVVEFPASNESLDSALFAMRLKTVRDGQFDMVNLEIRGVCGPVAEHYREQHANELHRFIG